MESNPEVFRQASERLVACTRETRQSESTWLRCGTTCLHNPQGLLIMLDRLIPFPDWLRAWPSPSCASANSGSIRWPSLARAVARKKWALPGCRRGIKVRFAGEQANPQNFISPVIRVDTPARYRILSTPQQQSGGSPALSDSRLGFRMRSGMWSREEFLVLRCLDLKSEFLSYSA